MTGSVGKSFAFPIRQFSGTHLFSSDSACSRSGSSCYVSSLWMVYQPSTFRPDPCTFSGYLLWRFRTQRMSQSYLCCT